MRNELFRISPTIKRMGYRYRTFYIYAVKPKSSTDETLRNKQIKLVMENYGISYYEVAACDEQVTKLAYVGAKIEVTPEISYWLRSRARTAKNNGRGGTLGCFVNMKKGKAQCGLLSKHVAEGFSDVFCVGDCGSKTRIGHIIDSTNQHQDRGLDISAAFMHQRVGNDGTMFKDTRNNPLKGRLCKYMDDGGICRSGQSVHIYGAVSKPGRGEITMPCVDSGLSSTLIQVEDEISDDGTVQSRFAKNGDSGAIVCVEDPDRKHVYALGMVIGTSDLTDKVRGTYLTLPLSKGLEQLENNTNQEFELC